MSKVKNNGVSELNKAIFTLLYDQYDCPDVTPDDYDDTFVDYIINILAGENGSVCPFKNYSMEKLCEHSTINCLNCHGKYLDIDCGTENEDVWRKFINKTY